MRQQDAGRNVGRSFTKNFARTAVKNASIFQSIGRRHMLH